MRLRLRGLVRGMALLIALVAVALAATVLFGLHEAASMPAERRITLSLPGIARGAAPYRIALLSDIHIGNRAMRRARLDAIVGAVNRAAPDLVVIAGDFVNGRGGHLESSPADLTAPLARLKAPGGVIATLGNHDHWTDPAAVRAALERAGITVLANRAERRGPLLIVGLDDAHSGHADIAAAWASARGLGGAPVAVTHSPALAAQLPPQVVLLLAGHTHCGQVVLPGIGSLAPLLGRHIGDARHRCGVVRDPGRTVVITAGLGAGSTPVRIGAPPDWWLITVTGA